ncbi:probable RNA-binding protein 19 [Diaphorina citri]|uniref:Probable RNA-binding protein 19 n=1 Tax=Diaphorina citri TaxID=121845 RepID=A0A3Q0J6R8_DIACI|nr:probable RNA-binding protein 19 [Diaphorina citri]
MSRIVVKNLPRTITQEQLKAKFEEKGTVTDVQLKYTTEGKFRRFAFIGYHREDQAQAALDYFNNTYVFSSRIKVEKCSNLGDTTKPKSWSKYAPDSSAYQKLHNIAPKQDLKPEHTKDSKPGKKSKSKTVDPLLNELVEKHKDDPTFSDFLQLHGKDVSKLLPLSNKDGEEKEEENEDESNNQIAHADISDMEYLKLKTKSKDTAPSDPSVPPVSKAPVHKRQYHTIVVKNLPAGVKKKDLKAYFKPLPLASVRTTFLGMAYIGFKDEKNCNKALNKNKSFWKGKQLNIYKYSKDNSAKYSGAADDNNNASMENIKAKHWKSQEDSVQFAEDIAESGRIFVRNLSYTVTEDDLTKLFEKYGPLAEVILPIDKETDKTKGFALVTFLMPEHATQAYQHLDGTVFLGRMLHLIPGKPKENEGNVVLCSQLDAFNQVVEARSKRIILVKNLPYRTLPTDLKALFEPFGDLGRVLVPPYGITGLVEFLQKNQAKAAFNSLAYTKFKEVPLYLEWAPEGVFAEAKEKSKGKEKEKNEEEGEEGEEEKKENTAEEDNQQGVPEVEENVEEDEEREPEPDTTLYIKNLNFNSTEDSIRRHFKKCGPIASVTVARKKDPKSPGQFLSMGYGFVQFYTRESLNQALKVLQNSSLDEHQIELKRSNRNLESEATTVKRKSSNVAKQTGSKILVRNIPFQAKQSEVEELFKAFGELKFVRLPKKMVGSGLHRGFGFVEFITKNEAKRAMKALCQSTHLYGRRLVLEWAEEADNVEDIRKRTNRYFGTGKKYGDFDNFIFYS